MNLTVGNKVNYPHQGPCRINKVVHKVIDGRQMRFYQLVILDESGGTLLVPTDKVEASGIRRLLERSEIPKLLDHLKRTGAPVTNWKQRALENSKLLNSGSAFDLAELVDSLTGLNNTKSLTPRDRHALDRARRLLICEISEVTGETKSATEEKLDKALQTGNRH